VLGSILAVLCVRLLFEGMTDLASVLVNITPGAVPIGSIVRVTFGLTIILFLIIGPRWLNIRLQIVEAYYRLFPFHIKVS